MKSHFRILLAALLLLVARTAAADEVELSEDPPKKEDTNPRRHRTPPPMRQWCSLDVAEQTFSTSLTGVVTYRLLTEGDATVAVAATPEEFMQLLSSTPGGVYLLRLTTDTGRSYSGELAL